MAATIPPTLGGTTGHIVDIEYNLYGSSRLGTYQDSIRYDVAATLNPYGSYAGYRALRQYELSNHLGNVMATLSDVKTYGGTTSSHTTGYLAKVLSAQNYYPFGMQMSGKMYSLASYSSLNKYRFGFNGQERETEIGTSTTSAEFWIYDGRIGRRWNMDPKKNVWESSYSTFANNPIFNIDHKGDKYTVYGKNESVEWNPGAEYKGEDKFIKKTFKALEKLTSVKGVGDVEFRELDGNIIKGNIINDFAEGGKFYGTNVNIWDATSVSAKG
jgi:RHS repeat-associated protein